MQGHSNTNNTYMDDYVFSGLKTVVQGASFDRLAAAVPNFRTSSDTVIQPFVDNFYTYERWGDHDGADGPRTYGAPGYSSSADINWMESYGGTTQYRVTEEIAQGAGCSSCSQGQGTFKYEYAANYSLFNNDPSSIPGTDPNMNMGYSTTEYNVWRMKVTEYLPQDGSNWATDNREVIYSNEVGQPMLEDYVQVAGSSSTITAMSGTRVDSLHSLITVTASNSFSAGQFVAISGVLPELYNGVFKIVSANSTSFTFNLSENYYGDNSESGTPPPAAYATGSTPSPGSVSVQGYATLVTNQWLTYFRYDDEGRLIETAQPSAVTGYDDSMQDLVDTSTTPLGLISGNSGSVSIDQYSGWSFDGRAGITANNSAVVGMSITTFPTSNVGFVEDSSYLSQTVLVSSGGSYSFSFSAADGYSSYEPLEVLVDGVAQSVSYNGGTAATSFTPASGTFETGTATLTLSAGPHTISFVGMSNVTTYSALITNVSLLGVGISDSDFSGLGLSTGSYQTNPNRYSLGGGAVAGNLAATYVQQGQQGSPIEQESFTYTSNTAGSATVYLIASDIVYGNTSGGDARTSTFSYMFFTGTNLIQKLTATAPGISSAQNGPGTSSADTTTTYFDVYGNPTWTKDGDGFINNFEYDPLTNGLLK